MRPTKFTTVTLNQSSAADSNKSLDRVEYSHRTIERPDVITSESNGVNQCQWRVSEERSGHGPRVSKAGSLVGSELHFDVGDGRFEFWKDKRPADRNE